MLAIAAAKQHIARGSFLSRNSIENRARCSSLLTSGTCHQRGCNTKSPLFKISTRTAYNTLVLNIGDWLSLAEVGQASCITNGLPIAKKYVLLLCGVETTHASHSGRALRYNYAYKGDIYSSLFSPTDDAFRQHIRHQLPIPYVMFILIQLLAYMSVFLVWFTYVGWQNHK